MDNYTNHTDTALEEFAGVIEALAGVIQDITGIEREKAEAASLGRHEQIDDFLKREQVSILQLRGLEKKRQSLAEALGWKDLTFRQILARAGDGQLKLLSPLFDRLDEEIRRLRDAKDASDKIIKVRLRELEYILASQQGEQAGADISGHFHDTYV